MENKENISRTKSRIPLPLPPLPLISKTSIKVHQAGKIARKPLGTVDNELRMTKTSRANPATPYRIRKKFVTERKPNEELDWDLKELKEGRGYEQKTQALENVECLVPGSHKRSQDAQKTSKAVTPADVASTLEPKIIKNIKRSLKRPHSREIQGLSPVEAKEDEHKRKKTARELFPDRIKLLDPAMVNYMFKLSEAYKSDNFNHLLLTEKRLCVVPKISRINRSCVNNWLLKANGPDGDRDIIQTACWYFDSVLSYKMVQLEKLQLVGSACYWIAQKLIGPTCTASYMVKLSKNAFTVKTLQEVEIILLKTLGWPSQPVTPSNYVGYLVWWMKDLEADAEIEMGANFLILCSLIADIKHNCEYPSVIAAAAVKNAVLLLKKPLDRLFQSPLYQSAESKARNFQRLCSVQRIASREVANQHFQYRSAYEFYSGPPFYIADRITAEAACYAIFDIKITS